MTRRPSSVERFCTAIVSIGMLTLLVGCTPTGVTSPRTPPQNTPTGSAGERGPQPIVGWANGGDIQVVHIGTCNGHPTSAVEETDETVTITITSTLRMPGDMCQDYLHVQLDQPLGERTVIDGVTGKAPPGIEG